MCYSVMVETDLKRLAEFHGASIDFNDLLNILHQKAKGDLTIKIPKPFKTSIESLLGKGFLNPKDSTLAERCLETWNLCDRQDHGRLLSKIKLQEEHLRELEAKWAAKASKTAEKKRDTAARVLAKLHQDLKAYENKPIPSDRPANIFQYNWAPLLISNLESPEHPPIIRFHRYQVRPRGSEVEPPAHINMFNARLDSLQVRKTWNPLFMRRHGILSLRGFYEWVPDPETKKPRVIRFSESDGSLFRVPALHETWHDPNHQQPPIHSFAIVTTEPPPEILESGHDRCPVVIGAEDLATWLQPTDKDLVMDLLQKPYSIHFKGDWARP